MFGACIVGPKLLKGLYFFVGSYHSTGQDFVDFLKNPLAVFLFEDHSNGWHPYGFNCLSHLLWRLLFFGQS